MCAKFMLRDVPMSFLFGTDSARRWISSHFCNLRSDFCEVATLLHWPRLLEVRKPKCRRPLLKVGRYGALLSARFTGNLDDLHIRRGEHVLELVARHDSVPCERYGADDDGGESEEAGQRIRDPETIRAVPVTVDVEPLCYRPLGLVSVLLLAFVHMTENSAKTLTLRGRCA